MTEKGSAAGTLETPKDAGKGPSGEVARWLMELELADKAEEEWRKSAAHFVSLVRDEKLKKRGKRYNIAAANVMTLEPALYAQPPRPDIRPRFNAEDPVASSVAKMLEKAVSFHLDAYDFDAPMKGAVHDTLVPGRAVTRVRYKPTFAKKDAERVTVIAGEGGKNVRSDTNEPVEQYETDPTTGMGFIQPEPYDAKVYEETCFEHVHWDDFRRGPGRAWKEVPWISFRHKLTRAECIEKFGETIGKEVQLDYEPDSFKDRKLDDKLDGDVFKRSVAWEIWDKETKKVIWIAPSYKDAPAKIEEDPLELQDFFPIPRPLYAKEDPSSLVPVEDYRIYQDQADELNIITRRISVLTAGLKFRGIYDPAMKGLADLMKGEENDFLPLEQSAMGLIQAGGFEKALFFLPIEKAYPVLEQLYRQRAEVKQEIFELSGVADIMRGATNANETLGAQKIKAQWGTQRLQDRQRAVQRYARDLIRLMTEIIAEKYEPMTLKLQTGVDVTPDMLAIMRSDGPRSFKIDIETDSTIAVDKEADQSNLAELTQGLGTLMQSLAPMVQGGAMPMDAAKAIVTSLMRKFKLGREVEDALEAWQKQQQPQGQQQDPKAAAEAQKAQAELQVTQAETQAALAKTRAQEQADAAEFQRLAREGQLKTEQMERQAVLSMAEHNARMHEIEMSKRERQAKAEAAEAAAKEKKNAA